MAVSDHLADEDPEPTTQTWIIQRVKQGNVTPNGSNESHRGSTTGTADPENESPDGSAGATGRVVGGDQSAQAAPTLGARSTNSNNSRATTGNSVRFIAGAGVNHEHSWPENATRFRITFTRQSTASSGPVRYGKSGGKQNPEKSSTDSSSRDSLFDTEAKPSTATSISHEVVLVTEEAQDQQPLPVSETMLTGLQGVGAWATTLYAPTSISISSNETSVTLGVGSRDGSSREIVLPLENYEGSDLTFNDGSMSGSGTSGLSLDTFGDGGSDSAKERYRLWAEDYGRGSSGPRLQQPRGGDPIFCVLFLRI